MLTSKAKQELSQKDYKFLSGLVARGLDLLTPPEKAHLVARRGYLSKEALEILDMDSLEEEVADGDGADAQVSPYATMDSKELKALCKDRGIVGVSKVDEMREALISDDNGELDGDGEDGEDGDDKGEKSAE